MIATGYSGNQMQHGEFTPGPCRVTSDGGGLASIPSETWERCWRGQTRRIL